MLRKTIIVFASAPLLHRGLTADAFARGGEAVVGVDTVAVSAAALIWVAVSAAALVVAPLCGRGCPP